MLLRQKLDFGSSLSLDPLRSAPTTFPQTDSLSLHSLRIGTSRGVWVS